MNLLIFSDIHEDWPALERVMKINADYYVAAGDLANWGKGLDKAGPYFSAHAGTTFVLPGNHESAADIKGFCETFSLRDLHATSVKLSGYYVAGLGYSNPTPFNTPGEYSEAELAEKLAPFADLKPLVLICHCPPKDTPLDEAGPGKHFGSSAVAEFVQKHQPEYFFCGHIHEAAGAQCQIGKTQCWNVGKKGYLLKLL